MFIVSLLSWSLWYQGIAIMLTLKIWWGCEAASMVWNSWGQSEPNNVCVSGHCAFGCDGLAVGGLRCE